VLCERLGRPVVAYDRLGFGRSSARAELPSKRFIREEAETFFPKVLEALRIDRFFVFGHSVGGGMAVACAVHLPDRCKGVITESAQMFVEQRTLDGIRQAQDMFSIPSNYEKLEKYHGKKTRWVLDAWTKTWLSPEFADWSLEIELVKMKCPVLVIHGDEDEYGSVAFPRAIAKAAGGPSKLHIIPGCGHVPHRAIPGEIIRVVDEFLGSI